MTRQHTTDFACATARRLALPVPPNVPLANATLQLDASYVGQIHSDNYLHVNPVTAHAAGIEDGG